MIASIDSNGIVLDVIVATLEEAQASFPDKTWAPCPAWVGIGMDIDTPEPEPVVIQPTKEELLAQLQALTAKIEAL